MSSPISAGYRFKITHKHQDYTLKMPSSEAYKDYYGIGYIYSGDRLIITPGRTTDVHKGYFSFIDKDLYHRTSFSSKEPYDNLEMKFRPEVADHIRNAIGHDNFDNLFQIIATPISNDGIELILQLLDRIEYEWNNYDALSDAMLEAMFIELFTNIVRYRITEYPVNIKTSPSLKLVLDAIHYLENHFQEDPSLNATANNIHVSSAHLSRLFTSELGCSYTNFLKEEKLNHAHRLLTNTNLSVSEVAAQSGFSNVNYFCDTFKKKNGATPLEFRRYYQNRS